jgi:hypothetical protein
MRFRQTARATALFISLIPTVAFAHGGSGGHFVYVPVYIGGGGPPIVPVAKTGDYTGIKSVAIISATAQKLTLGSKALLASHTEIDVSDWNLDDVIETTVANYLSPRFVVKQVPYDRAVLAAIPNSHFDANSDQPVNDYLSKLPWNGIDAMVVIRPDAEVPGPFTDGLSVDTPIQRPVETAGFEIDIMNRDGVKIGHALSRIALRKGAREDFASIFGPSDLRLTSKDVPTPYQRAELKNEFARLIAVALRETLRSLQLGIKLPEVGARNLVPIPAEKNPFAKMHTVSLVSAVGDRLDLDHRGAFFRHSLTTASVPEWNIDSEIETKMAAALDKRIAVKTVPVDRARLAGAEITIDNAGLSTPLPGLTPTSDVDAYIVALKRKSVIGIQADPVSGFGLRNQNGMDGESTTVFADYAIAIVDPHTLKPHWLQGGVTSPSNATEALIRAASNNDWPKDGGALAAEQSAALHPIFSEMMNDSVPETMYRMLLTGMMLAPTPGVTDLPPKPGATPALDMASQAPTAAPPPPPQ